MSSESELEIGSMELGPAARLPNFTAFLEENFGEVEFEEEGVTVKRHGMKPLKVESISLEPHIGIKIGMKLNGDIVGFVEVYENPEAISFEGEIPGIGSYKGKWSTHKGNGIILVNTIEGRQDGWEKVPFP